MTEVERIARLICQSIHAVDPDTPVVPSGFIYSVGGMQAIDPTGVVPLWKVFERAAKAVIEDRTAR